MASFGSRASVVLAGLAVVLGALSLFVRIDAPPANDQDRDLSLNGLGLSFAGIEAPAAPRAGSNPPRPSRVIEHDVQPGESLFLISEQHGLSDADLMSVLLTSRYAERLRRLTAGNRLLIRALEGRIQTLRLLAAPSEGASVLLSVARNPTGGFVVATPSITPAGSVAQSRTATVRLKATTPLGDNIEPARPDERPGTPEKPVIATAPPASEPSQKAPAATPDGGEGRSRQLKVARGDSLYNIFKAEGFPLKDLHQILRSGKDAQSLKRLRPGELLEFKLNADKHIDTLIYRPSKTLAVHFERQADSTAFLPRTQRREYERRVAVTSAKIDSSLYLAAVASGMPNTLTAQLVEIFGWDIDFALDIRRGDELTVLYEELFLNDHFVRTGNVLAARFVSQGRTFRAVRYVVDGRAEYFTPEGARLRRAFIRTPVRFARVSSGFTTRRRHPILHTIRAHRGVDYAAPRGTPVRATGDGRVIFAGRKGGYGKTVVIQHGGVYTTLYAHMTRYAKHLRRGKRVRQGQTIGYVGSTGLATGPHLHYEFRVRGVHRNPLTVPLPRANGLKKSERAKFLVAARGMLRRLASGSETKLAQAGTD